MYVRQPTFNDRERRVNVSSHSSKLDRFARIAQKFGSQIHLRSLRDAFATIIPLLILAGLATLINNVVLNPEGLTSNIIDSQLLATWQDWGNIVNNGTLNAVSFLIAIAVAYHLSINKGFNNPIASVIMAVACLFTLLPLSVEISPTEGDNLVQTSGVIEFAKIGTSGMFAGIITGLGATELFMKLSKSKYLKIHLGQGIPPAVEKSFNVMIPGILLISGFALFSAFLQIVFQTDFVSLVGTLIQEPLRTLNTSLPGYLVIYSIANFFFSIGIHHAVISGSLLDPVLLINIQENMQAFSNGEPIPNIINYSFHNVYGLTGGSGNTFALLIAIFIFSKMNIYRNVAKLGSAPGVFNINEPIIFGLPIVFNLPMMIPFVFVPAINITLAYFATSWNIIDPAVVMIPWTTPPLVSAYLATAGDWNSVIFQLCLIILSIGIYLPFLKISERSLQLQAEKETSNSK